MGFLDTIRSWVTENANQLVYVRIPSDRIDVKVGPPIGAYGGYVRVYLADMFLTKSRAWFADRYPCVSTQVRLDVEGRPGAAFSHVARPPEGMLSPGVRVNYPVTDLLPFSGNLVEIEAALLALKGQGYLDTALGVLESLSSLVSGPVAAAVSVAEKVARGVEKLVDEGDGAIHLGLHDAFGSHSNPLQTGYFAVILATPAQIPPATLGVYQNRLAVQAPNGEWSYFQGFDYMLYHIETLTQRDNWRLPAIQSAVDKAIEAALLDPGPRAEAYKKAAIVTALTCKDLTPLDRRRVAQAVKGEIEHAAAAGQGMTGGAPRALDAVVKDRAPSVEAAEAGEVATEEELLS